MIVQKYYPGDEIYIKPIYHLCFSGSPWNQEVTEEEAAARWQDHSSRRGLDLSALWPKKANELSARLGSTSFPTKRLPKNADVSWRIS